IPESTVFLWFITSDDLAAIDALKALESLPVSQLAATRGERQSTPDQRLSPLLKLPPTNVFETLYTSNR
ncbi:hypothetical protein F442_21852, partial [Phytophthora nicotianae P10297]